MTARPDARSATLVTLDGPAGVGKSSTARAVARELGYRYLDSGSLYRAVTLGLLTAEIPVSDWEDLTEDQLQALGITVRPSASGVEILLKGDLVPDHELRTERVTGLVSSAARVPAVRGWLWNAQQQAASEGRLVSDGRDMGSVVFPDAATRVFLVADPLERARRRLKDHGNDSPTPAEVEAEATRLSGRDQADQSRPVSPLVKPEGAHEIDTTHLSFERQVEMVVELARRAVAGRE